MGQSPSTTTTTTTATPPGSNIHNLLHYARTNYRNNPTESLAALLEAMTLHSGPERAHDVMERMIRSDLGARLERAVAVVHELLNDESTILYQQGRQDLLRQTVEDGTSVVCTKCQDVVASQRWQQHQQYWCRTIVLEDDDDMDETE